MVEFGFETNAWAFFMQTGGLKLQEWTLTEWIKELS